MADTRRCALAEVRPPISSVVSISEGKLLRDITVASFLPSKLVGVTMLNKSVIEMIGSFFSDPFNNQDSIEYLPSQAVAEFIKNIGFDGIEYGSAQLNGGVNLALFNPPDWIANSSKVFEVVNIEYKAVRERSLVEVFGYEDEEL